MKTTSYRAIRVLAMAVAFLGSVLTLQSQSAIPQDTQKKPAPADSCESPNAHAGCLPTPEASELVDPTAAIRPLPKSAQPWKPVYLSNGEPNWSGYWRATPGGDTYDLTGNKSRPDYLLQGDGVKKAGVHRISGTPDGNFPYQPWAAAKQHDIASHVDDPIKPEHIDTQAHCLLEGPVRVLIHSGFEIIQQPGYVVFITEENDEQVIIPTDGRPHVGQDIKLWQGDRRGHWEGNTLVVDITNAKAKSRLDMSADFYSPSAHFVERFTRVSDNTINYQATVTDPAVYTQPFVIKAQFKQLHKNEPHYESWEDDCHEGERSADRMVIPQDQLKANNTLQK
jgi:hypothetical protein